VLESCGFLTYPGRASHGMERTFRGKLP